MGPGEREFRVQQLSQDEAGFCSVASLDSPPFFSPLFSPFLSGGGGEHCVRVFNESRHAPSSRAPRSSLALHTQGVNGRVP